MNDDIARYCADQVRRFDHDRYLCALFVPGRARAHVLALHAFNVEVARIRELVSEPMMGLIRLQWWREAIDGARQGTARKHPVAIGLADAIRAHDLPPEPFERLLAARETDLQDEPPQDLAALESYAEATASTLIELTLAMLGQKEEAAREPSRHIGIAWALTGLLRAVPVHASRRRSFLPRDLVERAGLDLEGVFNGRPDEGLRVVARQIATRAREHLQAARGLRRKVPRGAVPALLPAVLADRYLARLERTGFSLFDGGLQRPGGDRALRLLWAALRGRY
jgi:NADH dehydrogenase [ubiquinone] 1 alpha subcomplex assembly factor 6